MKKMKKYTIKETVNRYYTVFGYSANEAMLSQEKKLEKQETRCGRVINVEKNVNKEENITENND